MKSESLLIDSNGVIQMFCCFINSCCAISFMFLVFSPENPENCRKKQFYSNVSSRNEPSIPSMSSHLCALKELCVNLLKTVISMCQNYQAGFSIYIMVVGTLESFGRKSSFLVCSMERTTNSNKYLSLKNQQHKLVKIDDWMMFFFFEAGLFSD